MRPYHMTVMAPGGRLGVFFLGFAAVYLFTSRISAGWAKRRYGTPAVGRHRRVVTA